MNNELLTERTRIRLITTADLNSIHDLHSLPETDTYNTLGIPKNIKESRSIIEAWIKEHQEQKAHRYTFAIESISNQGFIGLIGLKLGSEKYNRCELWFKIHSMHWNKGYASEVLSKMLDYGFDELKLHRIEAGCAVANIGSIKVLEKVGFIREGRGRQILPLKSGWSDNYEYAILETDMRNPDRSN
ncbi:MAG: GNAT family N-acetyltransferase [Bacteroidetes bacterium]|nr:GNAT family N-acetyltransferase [Bacteroidota bacterium]